MNFFSSSWKSLALSCALFLMPIMAMHAHTPAQTRTPLDERPVVEWSKLSTEEIQLWFSKEKQDTVLEIPEGSMFSLKMEIEGELFAIRGASPSEGPVLRLCTKKKFRLAKRGSKYWIKQDGSLWMTLEKAMNHAIENAPLTESEVEWGQDEYGPVLYFRNTPK